MSLSIALITFNEEKNLPATLKAVKDIADEIIIIDSYSKDNTLKIAEEFGAKIYFQQWLGYTEQKNIALEKCSSDWILSLDADEVVSPELKKSITEAMKIDNINGYWLNRKTFYMGRKLNHAWYPDRKLRLVRKSASPRWTGSQVHEQLTVEGETSLLKEELIHYSYKDFTDHMQKTIKYAKLSAESYQRKGKKAKKTDIIFRPIFAMINKLILKRALLDGTPGIIAALSGAIYVYMKYSYLWELNNAELNREKIS